ncbi:hypothetical protein THF1A12_320047 [Vibrio jasicida]|uniref:Uncharacterized protein n=1 Tax=Vibrio jasicida TaxID=766224 RepID=A0AAU9QSR2_9VIBR|nr:hypothetical protein THF1A12_320047 [Vibrio jasicida]
MSPNLEIRLCYVSIGETHNFNWQICILVKHLSYYVGCSTSKHLQ